MIANDRYVMIQLSLFFDKQYHSSVCQRQNGFTAAQIIDARRVRFQFEILTYILQENKYPNLFYTNLFLMEGGYKRFYEKYAGDVDRSLFGVRGYVDENDISFIIKRQSIKRRKNKAITRTIKRYYIVLINTYHVSTTLFQN